MTATVESRPPALLRGTAALATARIAERASSLVVVLLLSRHVGSAGLGAYVTAIAYYQLIATGAELGVSTYLVREIGAAPERTSELVGRATTLATAMSVLVTGAVWLAVPHLGYSSDLRTALAIAALAVLPASIATILQAVFVAHRRVEIETAVTIVSGIATVALSAVVLARGHGVVAVVVVFVAVRAAATIAYVVVTNGWIARIRPVVSPRALVSMLRDVRPFALSSLIGALFARPEIFLLSIFATEATVGRYSAAYKIVDLWQLVPQTFMTNVYPLLARAHRAGERTVSGLQRMSAAVLLAIGVPVTVGLVLAARPIVHTFFGDGFDSSILVLQVLAPSVVLFCIHSVLWRSLSARGDHDQVLRVQVWTVGVRLVLGAVLIAAVGAVGAAVAVVATLALHNGLLARRLAEDGRRMVDARTLWPTLVASLAMGVAVVVAGDLPLPALVVVAAAVYAAAMALLAVRTGRPPWRLTTLAGDPR